MPYQGGDESLEARENTRPSVSFDLPKIRTWIASNLRQTLADLPRKLNLSTQKDIKMFLLHPGNYALIALLALGLGLLISSGLVAGSMVAAMATMAIGIILAIVVLPIFVFFLAKEDKEWMAEALGKRSNNAGKPAPYILEKGKYVEFTKVNYGWSDYFLGYHEEKSKANGSGVEYFTVGSLWSRLLALASKRKGRVLIAVFGLLAFVGILVLGIGYLAAPAGFGFMAAIFGVMIPALTAGFPGVAALEGVFPVMALLLLASTPLVIVGSLNRFLTVCVGDQDAEIEVGAVSRSLWGEEKTESDSKENGAGVWFSGIWHAVSKGINQLRNPINGQVDELKCPTHSV